MQQYLIVGQILKPHGVYGELKVKPMTDNIERFEMLKCAYIKRADEQMLPYEIEYVKYGNNVVYIKFDRINDMDAAAELAGEYLWVDRMHAVPLPEGSYYVADIIGCSVYTESGMYLGKVIEVFPTGSNDVYVVADGDKQVLIPAIKDVIKEVDIKGERITITPIDGLLD